MQIRLDLRSCSLRCCMLYSYGSCYGLQPSSALIDAISLSMPASRYISSIMAALNYWALLRVAISDFGLLFSCLLLYFHFIKLSPRICTRHSQSVQPHIRTSVVMLLTILMITVGVGSCIYRAPASSHFFRAAGRKSIICRSSLLLEFTSSHSVPRRVSFH